MQPAHAPALFEAAARDVYNVFRPSTRRIDTFMVSFQKCGRTWLELMLAHVFAYKFGLAQTDLSRELPKMQVRAGQGPVIFSTHDWSETTGEHSAPVSPYLMTAYPLRLRYWGRPVLMVIRDPRDTIVSSYHQVTKRSFRPLPFTDIDSYVLDPLYGFPRLVAFYKIWELNHRFTHPFMISRYEDLHTDGVAQLARICEFVGLGGTPEDILSDIYAKCSIEGVRRMESAGVADLFKFQGEQASKARRGVVGGYRDELKPETIAIIEDWMTGLPDRFSYAL